MVEAPNLSLGSINWSGALSGSAGIIFFILVALSLLAVAWIIWRRIYQFNIKVILHDSQYGGIRIRMLTKGRFIKNKTKGIEQFILYHPIFDNKVVDGFSRTDLEGNWAQVICKADRQYCPVHLDEGMNKVKALDINDVTMYVEGLKEAHSLAVKPKFDTLQLVAALTFGLVVVGTIILMIFITDKFSNVLPQAIQANLDSSKALKEAAIALKEAYAYKAGIQLIGSGATSSSPPIG